MENIEHLKQLREDYKNYLAEDLDDLTKNLPGEVHGIISFGMEDRYAFLAAVEYYLDKNIELFKQYMHESYKYQIKLLDRALAGEPIYKDYLHAYRFEEILYALVVGEWQDARQIMLKTLEYNKNEDIGKNIQAIQALLFKVPVAERIAKTEASYNNYMGYAKCLHGFGIVIKAIGLRDQTMLDEGFEVLMKGHKKATSTMSNTFQLEDRLVYLWGIAFANLARFQGLNPKVDHPALPQELLCDMPFIDDLKD